MSEIVLSGVTKTFPGGVKAVDGITLTIESGELMVLVGPSGCGKTTLLRMIAGLETVDDGSIRLGDRDITHLEARERDIAMVFQNCGRNATKKMESFGLRTLIAIAETMTSAVERPPSIRFDVEPALLTERSQGQVQEIRDAQVLERLEREGARVQERCEIHDCCGDVRNDPESATERGDDACLATNGETGRQRVEHAGTGRRSR